MMLFIRAKILGLFEENLEDILMFLSGIPLLIKKSTQYSLKCVLIIFSTLTVWKNFNLFSLFLKSREREEGKWQWES